MTTVRIDLRRPAEDGVDVPTSGTLDWIPTRRRHVEEGDDDYVVLPDKFTVPASAAVEIEVAPTGPDWCWQVAERVTRGGSTRYLAVPESALVVDYGDLVEVDPATLEPTAAPEAAWWLAHSELAAIVADLQVAQVPPEQIAAAVQDYLAANPIEGVTQETLDAAIAAIELLPGPEGPAGADGAPGSAGPANTLTVGTVTTGAAGSSASAAITGAAPNQTLNLTIPRGATGTTGTAGTAGADGSDGASAYEVAVANGFVGTEAAWLASLVGPEGPEGPAGADGEQGPAGEPGQDATGSGLLNAVMVAGDSNVNSANTYGGTYMFHQLLAQWLGGVDCVSAGIGGATTVQVAASIGAAPVSVFLVGNQIPATGRVDATFEPAGAIKTWQDLVTGTIDGIHGRWYDDSGDEFGRTAPGDVHPVLPGTNFVPDWAGVAAGRAGVVWTGNNDANNSSGATTAVRYLKAIARKFGGRLIILTPKPGHTSQTTAYTEHENQYVAEFGPLVLNVRTFLNQHGLTWAGLTATADDTADIAAGKIPRALFHTDGVHLNDIGENVLARKVSQMLLAAGFVTLGPDPLPDGPVPPPVDTTAPTTPGGLASSNVTSSGFDLSWSASTDNVSVTGYRVRLNGTVYDTTTGTTMTVTGRPASTLHNVDVRAYDAAGNESTAATTSVTTSASADATAPSVPTGLVQSAVTSTGFTVSWDPSTDDTAATGYEVFVDGVSYGTTASTSLAITGRSPSTEYDVTVRARDAVPNWSTQSTVLSITTLAPTAYSIDTDAATIIDLSAETLSATPITSWAPTRGLETAALTANGTPDLLTAATPSGHKAVQFVRGGTAEYVTVDWPINYSTPSTIAAVVRFTQVDAYLSAGLSSAAPFAAIYYDNTNVIRTQVNAAGLNIGAGPAVNAWAVLLFVYDGASSRQYLNSTTPFTVTMSTGAIHTGITIGSNGSKSTPGGVDVTRFVAVNRALTTTEAAEAVTALKAQYGIS